jgi:hypothetical protein
MHCIPLRWATAPGRVVGHDRPVLAEAHARPYKVRGRLNWAEDPGFWAPAGESASCCLDPPPGHAHWYKWSYDVDAEHARYLERHARQDTLARARHNRSHP